MKITHSDAAALIRRGRDGRKKLQNNTYLEQRGDDFAVRLHNTDVITIHADGTYTLNTGGWSTVTTKDRINSYGPARVWSERGDWYIPSADDPRTPAKVQRCRGCKGTGQRHQEAIYSHGEYQEVQRTAEHIPGLGSTYTAHEYVRFETPRLISEAHDYECYSCKGTGSQDYGSKSMPVLFFDGIRVDSDGNVIDANNYQRLREPAEVAAARRLLAEFRVAVHQERRDRRYRAEREADERYHNSPEYLAEQARAQEAARQIREEREGGGQTYAGRLTTAPYETSDGDSQSAPDVDALLSKIDNVLDPASAGSKINGQFWIPSHP